MTIEFDDTLITGNETIDTQYNISRLLTVPWQNTFF